MDMNVQLHGPAALGPMKVFPVSICYVGGWVP
jgi:hypothetical protein